MSMERLDTPKLEIHHWPVVLLRVYTGIFFLKYGFGKVQRGQDFADGLAGFVGSNLENSFGFFRPVLESFVLPNKLLFAYLVAWGELLVGIALILGLATRYAAVAGAVMVSAFWFTKGQAFLAAQNHDSIWLMIFIALAGVPAGRVFGLDARLSERFRFLR
jgi:thiosulfate dehydrogenase [quinone] large subunit